MSCNLNVNSNEYEILISQLKREIESLSKSTTASLLIHDKKINEMCIYIKTNLSNNLRELFDTMLSTGEINQIIMNIFQSEIDDKVNKSDFNIQANKIANLENNKLDKNVTESITYAMLSQEVKENITGGNTAVVGTNSVNTSNIVDSAINLNKMSEEAKTQIYKNNALLNGGLISASYDFNSSVAKVSYDRSYLYVQSNDGVKHITIPAGSVDMPTTSFLVVKISDLGISGSEIVPTLLDNTTSRRDLFHGDYIILLSNQFGRLGGLFAQNTLSLANSTDINSGDKNVYLQVNSESSITLLKKCTESSNSYLGVDFVRAVDTTKNSNIWRISGVKKYTRNGDTFISGNIYFITSGEIESAIKINGASDFVGGSLHGYEETSKLEIYIDGRQINLSNKGTYSGNNITINRISNMYDYGTKNIFAEHKCLYEFNSDNLLLSQNIDFKLSKTLDKSYLGMYPVARKEGNNYISNHGIFTPTLENVDLFENHNTADRENVSGLIITNKNELGHHFYGKLEVLEKDVPTLKMNISNSEFYNKIYPVVCDDSYNVTSGETWSIKTRFTFDYKGISN